MSFHTGIVVHSFIQGLETYGQLVLLALDTRDTFASRDIEISHYGQNDIFGFLWIQEVL